MKEEGIPNPACTLTPFLFEPRQYMPSFECNIIGTASTSTAMLLSLCPHMSSHSADQTPVLARTVFEH